MVYSILLILPYLYCVPANAFRCFQPYQHKGSINISGGKISERKLFIGDALQSPFWIVTHTSVLLRFIMTRASLSSVGFLPRALPGVIILYALRAMRNNFDIFSYKIFECFDKPAYRPGRLSISCFDRLSISCFDKPANRRRACLPPSAYHASINLPAYLRCVNRRRSRRISIQNILVLFPNNLWGSQARNLKHAFIFPTGFLKWSCFACQPQTIKLTN